MIIFGYPGIGKTTLVKKNKSVNNCHLIDLESSCMRRGENDERDPLWYESYGNIAIDLHKQGYIVFCSSHKEVRDYVKSKAGRTKGLIKDDLLFVYPALRSDDWIDHLYERYTMDPSKKNKNAYEFAKRNYIDSITLLRDETDINRLEIIGWKYDLSRVLEYYFMCLKEPRNFNNHVYNLRYFAKIEYRKGRRH